MSTRDDVAKRAGVSPAVVSYVLNNSNYVSEEKRQAVLKAIKELNYHPNLYASSLKSGRSKEFLLITDDIRNDMFSEIAYYMEPVAYKSGYTLTVMSATQRKYDELIDAMHGHQFAGVFIFSGVIPFTKKYVRKLNQLSGMGIPIVLFMFIQNSSPLHEGITVLQTNIREAVSRAVDYLIEEKHHKIIAYLGDGDPMASGESEPFGDGLRVNGYIDALRRHGLVPRKDLVFFLDQFKYEDRKYLNTEGVVDAYFKLAPEDRPTAFFVNSDELAATLMKAFKKRGIQTPDDIQIIGFGETLASSIVSPELTTVDLPCKEIADCAIQTLIERAAGNMPEPRSFELRLIKKGSA